MTCCWVLLDGYRLLGARWAASPGCAVGFQPAHDGLGPSRSPQAEQALQRDLEAFGLGKHW